MQEALCLCGSSLDTCIAPSPVTRHLLKPGMVVVTEGAQRDTIAALIRWATGSRLTHAFIVTGFDEIVEAYLPRVRTYSLAKRVQELVEEDRAFYVLDLPGVTPVDRCTLARTAQGYVGRWYDVGQAVLFGLLRRFVKDGTGTVMCSRLVTGVFKEALNVDLFDTDHLDKTLVVREHANGECLPSDLIQTKLALRRFRGSTRLPAP